MGIFDFSWCKDSGWRLLCASRRPGMSPTPRSAKYPATHGCHHLRGGGNVRLWSSSPPRRRGGRCAAPWDYLFYRANRANGANGHFCGERCVCSAGLMAAICLPGEVRRPVPGCYLPGGALGMLSVGADASLRAAHCFSIAWMVFSSDSWICASQHSSSGNRLH